MRIRCCEMRSGFANRKIEQKKLELRTQSCQGGHTERFRAPQQLTLSLWTRDRWMLNLGAAGKCYFIGDHFAVNQRSAGVGDSAVVCHKDAPQDRLPVESNISTSSANVKQDVVPRDSACQKDLRVVCK